MTKTIRPLIQHVQAGDREPIPLILEHVSHVINYWTQFYHGHYFYAFPDIDETRAMALGEAIQFIHTCDLSQEQANLVKDLSRSIHNALEAERRHQKDDRIFRVMHQPENEDEDHSHIIDNLADTCIPRPEECILYYELRNQLETYLRKLDENERILIHQRYAQDLSFQEIAAIHHMSVQTVSSRLYRALEKLRRHMAA